MTKEELTNGKQHNRRVYAGYYKRYDGKLIYVARVVTDIDTGEEIVICQYANYSDTGEYYTITKESFCERIEQNGKMVYKYSRRTQQKIDCQRLQFQEQNGMPEPKRRRTKPQLDEYDNRGYRRSKTYYAYAKDLCEHYLLDCRKHQLCIAKKEYIFMSKAEFTAMTEDIIFLQQCLKTVLRDYNKYFKERFVDRLSIRKYAQEHNLNRGSVDYIQKKMFTALAAELKARDEADGKCRLCDPNTAPKYWD